MMGKIVNLKPENKTAKRNKLKMQLLTTFVAIAMTVTLFAIGWKWYVSLIPIVIHLWMVFYTFAVKFYTDRNKARAWEQYIKKYGGKMGTRKNEIHPHIRMTHVKLIKQGKKIPM